MQDFSYIAEEIFSFKAKLAAAKLCQNTVRKIVFGKKKKLQGDGMLPQDHSFINLVSR
jgi:hypothetical protein